MKIDNTPKTVGSVSNPAGSRVPASRPANPAKAGSASGGGESVTVNSAALHAVGGAEAAFDSQKVAEIRQAISEGRFQINPERIADGLISSVRQMLNRDQRPA